MRLRNTDRVCWQTRFERRKKFVFKFPVWLIFPYILTTVGCKCAESDALQPFFRVKCKTSTFKECLFQNSVKVAQIGSGHVSSALPAFHSCDCISATLQWEPQREKNMLLHDHQAIGTFQGFQRAESWK